MLRQHPARLPSAVDRSGLTSRVRTRGSALVRAAAALTAAVLLAGSAGAALAPAPAAAAPAPDATGPLTDRTNLSYTASGVTSKYHLYAAGLDWSKPVGLMVYADGTGEYGLKNPTSSYLIGGSNGLAAVAKRHNMVLVTPIAPGGGCACWYESSAGITPVKKNAWAEALVRKVQADYPVSKARVAMGGYSSGAQLATRWWVPSGAAQRTMTDGVVVPISYGGPPAVSDTSTAAFKSAVHINWNSGSEDPATENAYGARGGYNWYSSRGYRTSIDIVKGVGHGRSGQFGAIMDAQIRKHVPAGSTTTPAPAQPSAVSRVSGTNRYATAAAVAATFPTGRDAYVTTGGHFPDALAASARAGATGSPVLLTGAAALPRETVSALNRLKPRRIFVAGGSTAISDTVLKQLRSYATTGTVTRLGGSDRYATAAAIAGQAGTNVPVAYVVTGDDYPDAMSGAARAALAKGPVLLTRRDSVPGATAKAMRALNPNRVVVLGGTKAVSNTVANQLAGMTRSKSVQRVAGGNRYDTAARIAGYYEAGLDVVYVSTGTNYPDALAGSSRAGSSGAPMLLTRPDGLPTETRAALATLKPDRIVVLGGPTAVSGTVLDHLKAYVP